MVPFTESAIATIADEAARAAWSDGMTVRKPDGTVVEVPLVAEPEIVTRATVDALATEARAILTGAVKLARMLVASGDERDRDALLGPFQGLEAEAMSRLFAEAPCPAVVARVDFLAGVDGEPRALELNATIPAMAGYADLATHAWVRAAARARGMTPRQGAELVAACGSRMELLRDALQAFYAWRGGRKARPSIAIVARPGDAQIGELTRLGEHFRQMGHEAANLVPAECEPERWDVLYRHVWAHKTPPESPFARALLAPSRFVLANPVNGMLEAKALFARLSECAGDANLARLAGLDDTELAAARRLPFTRRLDAALAPRIVAERPRWVLKRSWDYGGKSVHLGSEHDPETWRRVVGAALEDGRGGGFVAQERVSAVARPGTRVTPSGVARTALYRDISAYTGVGPVAPGGCVVRAAASPIVNVLGGGGIAPVIPEDVIAALA